GERPHRLGSVRPEAGEALVGAPPEQEASCLADELLHAVVGVVRQVPASALEAARGGFVRAAAGLRGPVEGGELVHDHLAPLVSFGRSGSDRPARQNSSRCGWNCAVPGTTAAMGIVISLILIAFGAILTWAVNTSGGSVDPQAVGVILMVIGVVVFAI